ncbi:MAG: HPr family phosphocarrier protein [Lachnospiraceae bacterium]|nr:HPr family phosphocarrier protein [Lachnospiraceae bacterium]
MIYWILITAILRILIRTAFISSLKGLGVKCGQTVEVSVEGADEDTVAEEIKRFFETNL